MDTTKSWVELNLTRGPIHGKQKNDIGLILRVRARKEVEDFMSASAAEQGQADQYPGDPWVYADTGEPVRFYMLREALRSPYASFDGPNGGLLSRTAEQRAMRGTENDAINLSILTVVGVSNDVRIGIPGAYSMQYIEKFRTLAPLAIRAFLREFLVDVSINIQIISKA